MIRAWQGSPIAADWRAQWWVVFAVAAALRLTGLTASPIWYDEAFSWAMARLPVLDAVRAHTLDTWPPLWTLIEIPFVRLIPGELGPRLPAALAGIALLPLARALAEALGVAPGGILLGSALLAVLPYPLWLSQDARVYALLACLYLAAILFGLRRRWLGLAACAGLMLYGHTIAAFFLAPAGAFLLWHFRGNARRDWPSLIAALAGGGAAFAAWLPAFWNQTAVQEFWLGPFDAGEALLSVHIDWFAMSPPSAWNLFALFVLALSLGGALVAAAMRRGPLGDLGLIAFGPLALMVLVSPIRNTVFYRPLSPLVAPMMLFVGAAVGAIGSRPWRWAAVGLWTCLALVAVLTWSPAAKGGALRGLAGEIDRQWRPGDVLYHATGTSYLPFAFYLDDRAAYLLDEPMPDFLLSEEAQDAFGLRRAALESLPARRVWVVYARDVLLPAAAAARMDGYVTGARYLGRVEYWQAAPIEVYLLQESRE